MPARCQVAKRVLDTPPNSVDGRFTDSHNKSENHVRFDGPIAQLAEPSAHNRLVPGSIPGGPTIFASSGFEANPFKSSLSL